MPAASTASHKQAMALLDIDDPQHWRDAAAEIRRIISEGATAETKRAMSRIAEQYEHLAERTAHKGEV